MSWHFGVKSHRKEREGVGCYFANRALYYTLKIKGPVPTREEGEPQEAQKRHLGKMDFLSSEKSWRICLVLWLLSPWYRFSNSSLGISSSADWIWPWISYSTHFRVSHEVEAPGATRGLWQIKKKILWTNLDALTSLRKSRCPYICVIFNWLTAQWL